jgi:uncharacterized SAM-binding protein YcdF (DUF218 family)
MATTASDLWAYLKPRLLVAWAILTAILLASAIVMALMLKKSVALSDAAEARDSALASTNAILLAKVVDLQRRGVEIRVAVVTNTVLLSNALGALNEKARSYDSLSNWRSVVRLYQDSN